MTRLRTNAFARSVTVGLSAGAMIASSIFIGPSAAAAPACSGPTPTTPAASWEQLEFDGDNYPSACDYTLPVGVTAIDAVIIGGGGSAGGLVSISFNTFWGGGGGGGQVNDLGWITGLDGSGQVVTVAPGAGGAIPAAQTVSGQPGTDGQAGIATTMAIGSTTYTAAGGGAGGGAGAAAGFGGSTAVAGQAGLSGFTGGGGGSGSSGGAAGSGTGGGSGASGNVATQPSVAAEGGGGGGGAGGSAPAATGFGGPGLQVTMLADPTNPIDSGSYYGVGGNGHNENPASGTFGSGGGYKGTGSGVPGAVFIQYPVPPSGANGTPTSVAAAATGTGTVSVTYTQPVTSITGAQYSVDGGSTWTSTGESSSFGAFTIAGLATGTYTVLVRGLNVTSFGPSAASGSVSVTGSGGGSTPAPAPAPSATPTPTPTASASAAPVASPTPTPGGTVLPTGPLAPNLPGSNPAIPAMGLPLGGSVLLVNGQPQALTVRPSTLPGESSSSGTPTALSIEGPGFSMSIAGLGSSGRPLGLTPDGALILEADRRAAVEGSGFQPNTDVELYLFSEPRYIGKVTTNATGGFKDVVPLPIDVPAGRHTLQSNGFTADGQVRSVSLGVQLEDPSSMSARRPATAKTTVYFAPLSSVLDKADKAKLRSLVRKSGLKATKVQIVGYVQKGGVSTNDQALSLARAQAVASYVRSLGLKGAYVVKGGGVASVPGAKARNARVTIRFVR